MDEKILMNIGLSGDQAKVYLFLVKNGMTPAKGIATKTGLGRALAYKVLGQLTALGLAEKRENVGKIALFFPTHPQKVKEMITAKKVETEKSIASFDSAYNLLASDFNMLLGKPNVQFFEGVEGLQRVYDDILEVGEEIKIVSSPIDEHRDKTLHLIREQIKKQVAQNIRTKAITPHGGQEYATPVAEDEKWLITRKVVPAEKLHIPAQIIMYGDKVAITNFKENILTILIESRYIAETFRIMFEYIWEKS